MNSLAQLSPELSHMNTCCGDDFINNHKNTANEIISALEAMSVPLPVLNKLKVVQGAIVDDKGLFAYYKPFNDNQEILFEFHHKVYSQPKLVYVKCFDKNCECLTVKMKLSLYRRNKPCICIVFDKKRPNDPHHMLVKYIREKVFDKGSLVFNSLLRVAGAQLRMQEHTVSGQSLCYLVFDHLSIAKEILNTIENEFDPGIHRPMIFIGE